MSLSSQEYNAVEGDTIIIEVKASKTAGTFYEIYVTVPENNLTSKLGFIYKFEFCACFFTGTRYNILNPILIQFGPSDVQQQFELKFHNNSLIDPPVEFNVMLSIPDNVSLLGVMLGANQSATITVVDIG